MHGGAVTRGSGWVRGPCLLQCTDELCRLLCFVQCWWCSLPGARCAHSPSRAAQSPLNQGRGSGSFQRVRGALVGRGGASCQRVPGHKGCPRPPAPCPCRVGAGWARSLGRCAAGHGAGTGSSALPTPGYVLCSVSDRYVRIKLK